MSSEEPPEEPHVRAESALLSPASPKPIHFPTPTNIPVLTNMMDVDFNQTELHMSEPAMRNTELRDGAWKEADVPSNEETEAVSIVALNGEGDETVVGQHSAEGAPSADNIIAKPEDTTMPAMPSTGHLAEHSGDVVPDTSAAAFLDNETHEPTVPAVDTTVDATAHEDASEAVNNTALPNSDDLNSLLNSLKAAPSNASSNTPSTSLPPASVPHVELQVAIPGNEQPALVATASNADVEPSVAKPSYELNQDSHSSGNAVAPIPTSNASETNAANDLLAELTASLNKARAPTSTPSYNQTAATSTSPLTSVREKKLAAGEQLTEDDIRWTPDVQEEYDDFIRAERQHVNDGRWDSFPIGSRLFIGNLSSDSVTKRDIFHVFHVYGKLAQISIKQAYGFVQFLVAPDAERAMAAEEGREIRGKKIHIEVSHPQRSRNQQQNNRDRRSRSPERRGAGRGDRFRGDDHRSNNRDRSPHYRDRYDDRRRRSPSPDYRKSRYNRSPSPRSRRDELDMPMRAPDKIPDVQIVLRDNLDPRFVDFIEDGFRAARLRTAVIAVSPRQNEQAIIQRQILEGVTAISVLDISSQTSMRIGVQIFDRSRGPHDIRFQEFSSLSPEQAAGLVLAALPRGLAPQHNSMPTFSPGVPPQMPTPLYTHPHNVSMPNPPARFMPAPFPPTQFPPQGLPPASGFQSFLANMQPGNQQPPTPQSASSNGYPAFQQPPQPPSYPPRQQYPYPGGQPMQAQVISTTPSNIPQQSPYQMSPVTSAPPSANPQQPNMQEILARLGNYNK